jgi:RimJ/RimL family protein N-acetyltransferase
MIYETERLQVRHFSIDDLDDFAEINADSVVSKYMGDGEILSRETTAKWIGVCEEKYRTRGYGTSAVFEKSSGAFVGFCGVIRTPENDYDEIIYALSQSYWGQGYATEVAQAMLDYVFAISELDEIYATIHHKNETSLAMMPKLGMTFVEDIQEDDGSITKKYGARRPPRAYGA